MSIIKEVPRHERLSGLRIKRKVGSKIYIEHGGETLVIQIGTFFSGQQVTLNFQAGPNFKIKRDDYHENENEVD